MADLGDELEILGGGGRLGTALRAARYWPAAACGLTAPGAFTGSNPARLVLVGGVVAVALTRYAEKRMAGLA